MFKFLDACVVLFMRKQILIFSPGFNIDALITYSSELIMNQLKFTYFRFKLHIEPDDF